MVSKSAFLFVLFEPSGGPEGSLFLISLLLSTPLPKSLCCLCLDSFFNLMPVLRSFVFYFGFLF